MSFIRNKKIVNKLLLALGAIGGSVSLYLWDFHVNNSKIVCFTGCESVLSSEYGMFFGVPIAAYGFAYYAAVLLIVYLRLKISDILLDRILAILLVWGIIFSLYLRYLEFFVLYDICMWCWVSFIVIIIMSVLFTYEAKDRIKDIIKLKD